MSLIISLEARLLGVIKARAVAPTVWNLEMASRGENIREFIKGRRF